MKRDSLLEEDKNLNNGICLKDNMITADDEWKEIGEE